MFSCCDRYFIRETPASPKSWSSTILVTRSSCEESGYDDPRETSFPSSWGKKTKLPHVDSSIIWLAACHIYALLDGESSPNSVAVDRSLQAVISVSAVGSCRRASPTAAVSRVQG